MLILFSGAAVFCFRQFCRSYCLHFKNWGASTRWKHTKKEWKWYASTLMNAPCRVRSNRKAQQQNFANFASLFNIFWWYVYLCVLCFVLCVLCFVLCLLCFVLCVPCFVLFRLCMFILICFVCTSVRTTATEWQQLRVVVLVVVVVVVVVVVLYVLVFTVFCIVCTVFFVLFRLCMIILIFLYIPV